MKLISLYIENFGGLHQYAVEFSEGLTVIREANGFGKTTLAEFIRAMFYGFPRKAKTLDKNRRQKYTPWQGGKFGGNLTFQLDGKEYRIERTFGATPKGDKFNLIDLTTNKKSDRFSEEIGQEIFGLDADSFERSTYMPQLREKIGLTTDSIRAKLGDLVEDTGDVGNFEKAITSLKTKRSYFVPYRGNGGTVAEAASRISSVQEELDAMAARDQALESCKGEMEGLKVAFAECQLQLADVRKEITLASEMAASAAVQEQYRGMQARMAGIEDPLKSMEAKYPAGIPAGDELEAVLQLADRKAVLMAQNLTGPEDLAAQRFEEENRGRFAESVPTETELENCRILLGEHQNLQAELKNTALSQSEQEQYARGKELWDSGALDKKRLEKLDKDFRELESVRGILEHLEAPAETDEVPAFEEKKNLGGLIFLVLGFVGMAAGIVLMVLQQLVLGGVILGLGVLALIGGIFGSMKTMMVREMARQRQAQAASDRQHAFLRKRGALEEQVRILESELYRELGRGDFRQAMEQLRLTRSRYLDVQEKMAHIREKQAMLHQNLQETEKEILAFLGKFYGSVEVGSFYNLLDELRRDAEAYMRAKATLEAWQLRKAKWTREVAECDDTLADFCEKWHLNADGDLRVQLRQVRDDLRRWEDLTEQGWRLNRELTQFLQEHAAVLDGPVAEEIPDAEELKRREALLLDESADLTRQLLQKRQLAQDLRSQLERIPDLQSQLEAWKIQKAEGQVNARLLDETVEFLQMAKDSLSSNYLGPIQRSFREYLGAMTQEENRILVTGDLDVQLERQGEARDLGYFSAGQMDAVMLCMRFALVDALFTEEKPFVILDDPFVNLDDKHTAQALELLQKLAGDRQVIYLVCHSARAL